MAFRWRADDGPLIWYLDTPTSPQLKKKHSQSLQIFWIRACQLIRIHSVHPYDEYILQDFS